MIKVFYFKVLDILRKRTSKYLLLSLFSQAFSFFFTLIIWGNFNVVELNIIVYTEVITLISSAFFGISSDQFINRKFYDYSESDLKRIIFNTWIINWLSVFVVFFLSLVILLIVKINYLQVVLYSILASSFTYFNQLTFILIRYENKYANFLIHNILSVFFKSIFVYYFILYDKNGVQSYYVGMMIASLIILPWYVNYMRKRSIFIVDKEALKQICKFSFPIIPSVLVSNFVPVISRVIIQGFANVDVVAFYALISRITSPITSLQNALRIIFVPQVVEAEALGHSKVVLEEISYKYFSILLFFTSILSAFANDLTGFFWSQTFFKIPYLSFFFLAYFMSNIYTYLSIGVFLANKNSFFIIPALLQVAVMIFPGVFLIREFNVLGLLFTEFTKYFLYVISGVFLSYYFFQYPVNIVRFLKPFLVILMIIAGIEFLDNYFSQVLMIVIKIFILSTFFLYFYKTKQLKFTI